MRASTRVVAVGLVLFVLPLPGTFVAGALVALGGGAYRVLLE